MSTPPWTPLYNNGNIIDLSTFKGPKARQGQVGFLGLKDCRINAGLIRAGCEGSLY